MTPSTMNLDALSEVRISQRKELAEVLLGAETRNKYEIRDAQGASIGFAAEQGAGFLAFLARMFMGHWRTFEVTFFDAQRKAVLRAVHPFRFFFQRLEIFDASGTALGALQQRWAVFSKRFDVEDAAGRVILEMRSPLLKVWTFPFFRGETEVGRIEKKWSGGLAELLTDADNFRLSFSGGASSAERRLMLAAAVFVDLQYFERKAS